MIQSLHYIHSCIYVVSLLILNLNPLPFKLHHLGENEFARKQKLLKKMMVNIINKALTAGKIMSETSYGEDFLSCICMNK